MCTALIGQDIRIGWAGLWALFFALHWLTFRETGLTINFGTQLSKKSDQNVEISANLLFH